MRVIAISCVRNEADIIEAFVRHTLSYCERMIILDHGSTDATGEILDKMRGEGLPLDVVVDATLGHMLATHTNRLLKIAAGEYAADWIVPLDGDEFICGSSDASFLPPDADGKAQCLKLRMKTYYPKKGDDPNVANPVERITHRLAEEPSAAVKVLVPGRLARESGGRLDQGHHRFIIGAREAPSETLANVWVAHFSLRTAAQYGLKMASKYLQWLRANSAGSAEGVYYREAYSQIKRSYSRFAASFETQPLAYLPPHDRTEVIRDPMQYRGGPLRHTPTCGDSDEFVNQLLMLAERLAATGAEQNDVPDESSSSAAPLLSVEAYAYPEGGAHEYRQVQALPAVTHSLEFDLNCDDHTTELRIGLAGAAGMVEIDELSLEFCGAEPARQTYHHADLNSMLRVLNNAAAYDTGKAYRLFIATHLVLVSFRGWQRDDERLPRKLRLKLSYNDRRLEGNLLHVKFLNFIAKQNNAVERLRGELESSKNGQGALLKQAKYVIGSTIDFSKTGNGRPFMRAGWSHNEPWGTWTHGREAILLIRLAEIPRRDLQMNLCVRAFAPPGHPERRVNVHLNGKLFAKWKLTNADFTTIRSEIGRELVREGVCEFVFEIVNPISPKRAGASEDSRLLGLGCKSLELQEQAPAA